jgi:copper chaperone CopZ
VRAADPPTRSWQRPRHEGRFHVSTLTVLVPGMTCRHCVRKVTAVLRDVPGVQLVQADLTTGTVVLRGDPTVSDVLAALDRAGFPGTVVSD